MILQRKYYPRIFLTRHSQIRYLERILAQRQVQQLITARLMGISDNMLPSLHFILAQTQHRHHQKQKGHLALVPALVQVLPCPCYRCLGVVQPLQYPVRT